MIAFAEPPQVSEKHGRLRATSGEEFLPEVLIVLNASAISAAGDEEIAAMARAALEVVLQRMGLV
jgi:hypothetical protein